MTVTNKPTFSKTIESIKVNLDTYTNNEMFFIAILFDGSFRDIMYLAKTQEYLTKSLNDARLFSAIEKNDALFLLSQALGTTKAALELPVVKTEGNFPELNAPMSVMVIPCVIASDKAFTIPAVEDKTTTIIPEERPVPKQAVRVPHPDFFNGFNFLTSDKVLNDIADESIWQVTDKIRASGQFSAKQHGTEMRYKYSFNGVFPADTLLELTARVMDTGWYERVYADIKGEGPASYTVITFVLKVQHGKGSHISL